MPIAEAAPTFAPTGNGGSAALIDPADSELRELTIHRTDAPEFVVGPLAAGEAIEVPVRVDYSLRGGLIWTSR